MLAALGVQSLFDGTGAINIAAADALRQSPSNLMVGHTRASGDNANVLGMLDSPATIAGWQYGYL